MLAPVGITYEHLLTSQKQPVLCCAGKHDASSGNEAQYAGPDGLVAAMLAAYMAELDKSTSPHASEAEMLRLTLPTSPPAGARRSTADFRVLPGGRFSGVNPGNSSATTWSARSVSRPAGWETVGYEGESRLSTVPVALVSKSRCSLESKSRSEGAEQVISSASTEAIEQLKVSEPLQTIATSVPPLDEKPLPLIVRRLPPPTPTVVGERAAAVKPPPSTCTRPSALPCSVTSRITCDPASGGTVVQVSNVALPPVGVHGCRPIKTVFASAGSLKPAPSSAMVHVDGVADATMAPLSVAVSEES